MWVCRVARADPLFFCENVELCLRSRSPIVVGKTTIIDGETAVKNLKDCNKIVTLRVNTYVIANN